jgi:hypothetical protein
MLKGATLQVVEMNFKTTFPAFRASAICPLRSCAKTKYFVELNCLTCYHNSKKIEGTCQCRIEEISKLFIYFFILGLNNFYTSIIF